MLDQLLVPIYGQTIIINFLFFFLVELSKEIFLLNFHNYQNYNQIVKLLSSVNFQLYITIFLVATI